MKTWERERSGRRTTLYETRAQPAAQCRVQGVMFYSHGLFVSGVMFCPLTPPPPLQCLCHRWDVQLRPPSGLRAKECGCKMYVGYSGKRAVNQCGHWRAPGYCFTGQYAHTCVYHRSHLPASLLLLLSHTHSSGKTCLTQFIWKRSHSASRDKNKLRFK